MRGSGIRSPKSVTCALLRRADRSPEAPERCEVAESCENALDSLLSISEKDPRPLFRPRFPLSAASRSCRATSSASSDDGGAGGRDDDDEKNRLPEKGEECMLANGEKCVLVKDKNRSFSIGAFPIRIADDNSSREG